MMIHLSLPEELRPIIEDYTVRGSSIDALVSRLLVSHFSSAIPLEPDTSRAEAVIRVSLLEVELEGIRDHLDLVMKKCADLADEIRGRS